MKRCGMCFASNSRLGLFEHPYVDEEAAAKALYHPESIALAQTAAERSFVLLKNANGPDGKPLLPLAMRALNIAVIGPLGDDSSYPGGAPQGSGPRVSLPAALAQRVGESHVSRFKGVGILDGTDEEIAAAVAGAQKADVVILTLGESSGDERRGGFARASGTSGQTAGIAGSYCQNRQAGGFDSFQRTAVDCALGV